MATDAGEPLVQINVEIPNENMALVPRQAWLQIQDHVESRVPEVWRMDLFDRDSIRLVGRGERSAVMLMLALAQGHDAVEILAMLAQSQDAYIGSNERDQ